MYLIRSLHKAIRTIYIMTLRALTSLIITIINECTNVDYIRFCQDVLNEDVKLICY